MTGLEYRGKAPANASDVATQAYLTAAAVPAISAGQVSSLINTALAPYALVSQMTATAALDATKAYVDGTGGANPNGGDAGRLHLSQVNRINGVCPLDTAGLVPLSAVPVASTQRFPAPFYSPGAYNTGTVTATTAEVTLYTQALPDPTFNGTAGSPYQLLLFGSVDAATSADGNVPIVRVRAGSATGPVVGQGMGLGERYWGGQVAVFASPGSYTYTVPSWAATVDVVCLGAGGAGQVGGAGINAVNGQGGGAGAFGQATLTVGSTLPTTTATLQATVGVGTSNYGQASTVTGAGVSAVTGGGGTPANQGIYNPTGAAAGAVSLNGYTYAGGGAQPNLNATGNGPGGGGAGGSYALVQGHAGGAGASGAVWFSAYPSPAYPTGQVTILPVTYGTALTGASTLYVTLSSSGGGAVSASTLQPALWVCPVPA